MSHFYYALQEPGFDVQEEHQKLASACPESGAIVTFTGLVRDSLNTEKDKKINNVESIELSTYEELSKQQLKQLGNGILAKFDLHGLRIIHRIGVIKPQEQIVFVATASKHRADAFAAANMTMDFLKSNIAFWKKENYNDGKEPRWIEPTEKDYLSAEKWR